MTNAIEKITNFFRFIIQKEVTQICQSYVPENETYVFIEGPRYSTLGYTNIAKGWQDFCNSGLKLEKIEWLEGSFTKEYEKSAWVAGIILITLSIKGKLIHRKFRATFVLEKNQVGNWEIRHEHISAPLEDPYGIGDWLQKNENM
jgi:ketosteroid isomerase-like protein